MDAVFLGNAWVLVDINLDEVDTFLLAFTDDIGSDSFARSAPGGMEVNQAPIGFSEHLVELFGSVGVV